MADDEPRRKAGQFADERFRARRRTWLRRVAWLLPLAAIFVVAVTVLLGGLLEPGHLGFFWGAGIGAALAMVMCLADSPPHHIERWRQGAEGERATAKALRPLRRSGWAVFHDVETGRGNIDHLLVGPAGVFLVETKSLSGRVSVRGDVLSVRWREDPNDGYENRTLGPSVRAAAHQMAHELNAKGLRVWVQPLVVLWADFEQVSIESRRVAWVRGKDLATVLADRPIALPGASLERAEEIVAAFAAAGPQGGDDSAPVFLTA